MRDEGRAARKAREEGSLDGSSENQERRRRMSKHKRAPDPLTLRRSIAPGSYESWSDSKPKEKGDEVDRQIKVSKTESELMFGRERQSDSDVERYIEEQREAFRRPSKEEKQSSREAKLKDNFRNKISASSPPIGREDLFEAERSRQKRARESSSSSGEEDERLRQLKWSDVVTSDVVERQQAVMDFYANKRKEERRRLEEAKGRVHEHRHLNLIQPEFEVGDDVSFQDNEAHICGRGRITKVIKPGETGNEYIQSEVIPFSNGPMEVLYEIDSIANDVPGKRGWIKESTIIKKLNGRVSMTVLPVNVAKPLHDMRYVGIDTCSAVSVSTDLADFFYLDRSEEARTSVSLNGVGSGGPTVL